MVAKGPGSGEGFSKGERLLKRPEFLAVQRYGKRHHDRLFVALWMEGDQPWIRIGITASRRVGNAVRRNRAKRLVREAFRRNKRLLPQATDLVIIARSELSRASYGEVERALLKWAKWSVQCQNTESDD